MIKVRYIFGVDDEECSFFFLFGYPFRGWGVFGMYVLPSFLMYFMFSPSCGDPGVCQVFVFGASKSPGSICFLSWAVFGVCWYGW